MLLHCDILYVSSHHSIARSFRLTNYLLYLLKQKIKTVFEDALLYSIDYHVHVCGLMVHTAWLTGFQ